MLSEIDNLESLFLKSIIIGTIMFKGKMNVMKCFRLKILIFLKYSYTMIKKYRELIQVILKFVKLY